MHRTFDRTSEVSTAPEWTYRHAETLKNHWWWRPGWKVGTRFYAWHITFDQQPAIHELAAAYQAELASVAGLDVIPARWLHLTMQGVGHVEDVSDGQITDLLRAARIRLADLTPSVVRFKKPVIRPEAIVLPPHPVSPIQAIRGAVRTAIGDTFGAGAVPERATGYQPHVSLAYVSADQPITASLDAINRVHVEPVDATIGAVSLIKMHRDSRMYEWETIETVSLGTSGDAVLSPMSI